jgi:hypothetical protein
MVQPPFEEGHFVKPTFRKHCLPLSGQRAAVPSSENFKISMVAPMNLKITKVALKNSSMMATKFYVPKDGYGGTSELRDFYGGTETLKISMSELRTERFLWRPLRK